METTVQKVIDLLCEAKEGTIHPENFNAQSSIVDDAMLDSLQMINFMLRVEEEFELEIDFDNFSYDLLGTIADFCEFIEAQKGE